MTQTVEAHGARIPVIGLGTWPMKDEECVEAVKAALQAGYGHIDTAAAYKNEEFVGEGIRASGLRRDDVFITTKIWPVSFDEGRAEQSAEESLKKLGVDAADLILIHWPSKKTPIADMVRAINGVKRRGLARHIGVSNFTTAMLDEAWAATDAPLVANQCEYHPYLSQAKVLAATRRHGMAFVSYAPLGRRDLLDEPVVQDVAQRLGRTAAQVLLRWHFQQGVVAVPKSARPARIAANIDIFGFSLSDADMAALSGLADPDGRIVNMELAPEWDK